MDPITNEEDVKYQLGRLYFQRQNYKKAIEIYKEGLNINPNSILLLYEIALAYSKLNDYEKACECWIKLLKIEPDSFIGAEVMCRLGRQIS